MQESERDTVLHGLQTFLGVEPHLLRAQIVKVTTDHFLGTYVQNYEELRDAVAPYSVFRAMLQHQLIKP
eukprot:scaffold4868_cov416-Prasinococcus_capsulatus_cf.AAC.17